MMVFSFAPWQRAIEARFDALAIGLSGICALHCLASAVLVALAASVGGVLLNPIFHEVGLAIAVVLGAGGLGRGMIRHGYRKPALIGGVGLALMVGALWLPHDGGRETLLTLAGVALLALGHDLNRRAATA